jgi:Tol biopolymer transport system component
VGRIRSAIACAVAVTGPLGCGQILGLADPVDPATNQQAGGDAASDVDADGTSSADATPSADVNPSSEATPSADAGPTCDLTQPFGIPTLLEGTDINTTANEGTPRLSPDQLTLYFWSDRSTGDSAAIDHLYVATRAHAGDKFSAPLQIASLDPAVVNDDSPTLTMDSLTLVFGSDRESNLNGPDQLFMATRASETEPFVSPTLLANVNQPQYNQDTPYLRPDGKALYFATDDPGGQGLHDIARSPIASGAFALPAFVESINTPAQEFNPCVTPDETTVLWGSNRADLDGHGDYDVYIALRPSSTQAFTSIANAGDAVNSPYLDLPGWISPDGCTLYMESTRADGGGDRDLYVSRRSP